MNEIHHIHLGRQAYTIAADAYKQLHDYLEAIRKKVGKEVAEEVELRMSELLAERGVTGEKVVLQKDVNYLKSQLGTPGDFGDEEAEEAEETDVDSGTKRLFRDMDNAMIAGVAAGLGQYFGVSVLVIRLLFVLLTFFGGGTVVIYLLLWLLVPEARTNSDRLQMEGKAVNVDNIKRVIDQADVPGVTRRATRVVSRIVLMITVVVLSIVGVVLVAGGVGALLAATSVLTYGLAHGLHVGTAVLFPVGGEQIAVLLCGFLAVVLVAVMLVTSGLAMLRRRGVIPAWAIAALVGTFIAAAAVGTALGFDVAPAVGDRYQSLQHSRHVAIKPFTKLHLVGRNVFYISQSGPKSDVEIRTLGKMDTSAIKVSEKAGVLTIDTTHYHPHSGCSLVCPFGTSNTEVVIQTPDNQNVYSDGTPGAKLDMYGTGGPFQSTYNL